MTTRTSLLCTFASALTLFALAGCATDVEPIDEPVVAPGVESTVDPLLVKCTTTREDAGAYVCYTTTCAKTQRVECYPKQKTL